MTRRAPGLTTAELGRFLELQNLGLNVPFAVAFALVAVHGLPSTLQLVLLLIAFVAARNLGHSFNRWADRAYDAANPRTAGRALVTGRLSGGFALSLAAANAGLLAVAAWALNPRALLLAPVAIGLIVGYSYTKRYTAWTTVYLGLVEAITPGAVYIALTGDLPAAALVAAAALVCWGTAFETIHSLGDWESDRDLGLRSLPVYLGPRRAARLVPVLHAGALALFAAFGYLSALAWPFYIAVAGVGAATAIVDARFVVRSEPALRTAFRSHFVFSAALLAGVAVAVFLF